MAKIKPSRFTTPHIVQPQSRSKRWLWGLILIACGLWTWQVYEYGLRHAQYGATDQGLAYGSLREQLAELERERDQLRLMSAEHERASQVERETTQAIQTKIVALQAEREQLKHEVARLRDLVGDGNDDAGGDVDDGGGPGSTPNTGNSGSTGGDVIDDADDRLDVVDYSLRKSESGNRYLYAFTLSRDAPGPQKVQGRATIRVSGRLNGEPVELPLAKLTSGSTSEHKLGFKHFQKIEGELTLPPALEPQALTIEVLPDDKDHTPFRLSFDWI